MTYTPSFQDIAHLGHVEIFTPKIEESVAFFKNILGLHESGRSGDSVFLRAWGDYALHTLQLTASKTSGLGHMAFRTRSSSVLAEMTNGLIRSGVKGQWLEHEFGHGPAFRFASPDGHGIELYYDRPREQWFDADGAPILKLEYFDPVELVSTPTPQLGA